MPQLTQDELLSQLDRLKRRPRISPSDYKTHMPSAIPLTPPRQDTTYQESLLDSVSDRSSGATREALIMQQNKRDYEAMLESQRRLESAQSTLKNTKRPKFKVPDYQPVYKTQPYPVATQVPQKPTKQGKVKTGTKSGSTGSKSNALIVRNTSSAGWQDPTPFRGASVGGDLVTIRTAGGQVTVNRAMADNFKNFINALVATGYKITSLSGYANRGNTSDPSVKSMHAYGLAIDINPSQNPYGQTLITNMPKGVGRLAAKYGLQWGGNWNSVKDAMHFSLQGGYGGSGG